MIRRLAIFFLCIAIGFVIFLNMTLYLGLGGERTDAQIPDRHVSDNLLSESSQMAKGIDDQILFVQDKLAHQPVSYRRPQLVPRDPFGIVTKKEEEVVFTYKLSGIVGAENGFVAVLSDGKQTVFVKEGQPIGQTPFVLKKLSPYSAEISGPKEIRLTLGGVN